MNERIVRKEKKG